MWFIYMLIGGCIGILGMCLLIAQDEERWKQREQFKAELILSIDQILTLLEECIFVLLASPSPSTFSYIRKLLQRHDRLRQVLKNLHADMSTIERHCSKRKEIIERINSTKE